MWQKNEDHLNDSWDYLKMSYTGVIEVLGRQEKEGWGWKELEQIIA